MFLIICNTCFLKFELKTENLFPDFFHFISLLYSLYWIVFNRSVVIKLAWHMTWMLCKEYIQNKALLILSQVKQLSSIFIWPRKELGVTESKVVDWLGSLIQSGSIETGPLPGLCPLNPGEYRWHVRNLRIMKKFCPNAMTLKEGSSANLTLTLV